LSLCKAWTHRVECLISIFVMLYHSDHLHIVDLRCWLGGLLLLLS
jgi:hypothetical protein